MMQRPSEELRCPFLGKNPNLNQVHMVTGLCVSTIQNRCMATLSAVQQLLGWDYISKGFP